MTTTKTTMKMMFPSLMLFLATSAQMSSLSLCSLVHLAIPRTLLPLLIIAMLLLLMTLLARPRKKLMLFFKILVSTVLSSTLTSILILIMIPVKKFLDLIKVLQLVWEQDTQLSIVTKSRRPRTFTTEAYGLTSVSKKRSSFTVLRLSLWWVLESTNFWPHLLGNSRTPRNSLSSLFTGLELASLKKILRSNGSVEVMRKSLQWSVVLLLLSGLWFPVFVLKLRILTLRRLFFLSSTPLMFMMRTKLRLTLSLMKKVKTIPLVSRKCS